jgi:hypothetical protein
MRDDRHRESYRGHDLVVAKEGSVWHGVAWKSSKKLRRCTESSSADALADLQRFVDGSLDDIASRRTGSPSEEEYVTAFRKMLDVLTDKHRAMLKAHYHAPNQTMTATELAKAAGYRDYSATNLQYGNVGKRLYEELPTILAKRADGSPVYTSALATEGQRELAENHWTWKMRSAVAFALKQVGLT